MTDVSDILNNEASICTSKCEPTTLNAQIHCFLFLLLALHEVIGKGYPLYGHYSCCPNLQFARDSQSEGS